MGGDDSNASAGDILPHHCRIIEVRVLGAVSPRERCPTPCRRVPPLSAGQQEQPTQQSLPLCSSNPFDVRAWGVGSWELGVKPQGFIECRTNALPAACPNGTPFTSS